MGQALNTRHGAVAAAGAPHTAAVRFPHFSVVVIRCVRCTADNLAACIFLLLWSNSGMLSRVVLPLLIAVLLAGCGESPEPSRPTPVSTKEPAQGQKTDAAPAKEQPAATTVSNAYEAALNAALVELTQALRKYSFEHQRLPKTLSELVAAGYLKDTPQAPPGKKFAINEKTVQVVLVNQ